MKKAILLIVMTLYLFVSSGVIVNFHYCMNRLASTEFFGSQSEKCGKCGMHADDADGCCKDEIKVVKMEEDVKPSSEITCSFSGPEFLVSRISAFLVVAIQDENSGRLFSHHPPPLLSEQDTYLQISVFRI